MLQQLVRQGRAAAQLLPAMATQAAHVARSFSAVPQPVDDSEQGKRTVLIVRNEAILALPLRR